MSKSMNGTGNDEGSVTEGLPETISTELITMRKKHGAETPVGHRISNLLEQCEHLRSATGDQRAHLLKNIERQMDDIKRLTPDQAGG